VKAISTEGSRLARYLKARHPPVEEDEIRYKGNEMQQQLESRRKNRIF
jgi:hypothetical protein